MGYESQEKYDLLYSNMTLHLSTLFQEYPHLEKVNSENESLLEKAFNLYLKYNYANSEKHKSAASGLQACLDIAFANYMLRTAGCVAMTGVHPLAALACQVANSSIFGAEQAACMQQHSK